MTSNSLTHLIGQTARVAILGQHFPIIIRDAREAYGRVDLLTEPVGGSGQKWRSLDTIKLTAATQPK